MSLLGHSRHFGRSGPMSVLPPILLQKSKVAGRLIFREITKREAIADSYRVTHISEVACEINVRRRGPPHLYTKIASAARRIFDHQCKTTFATQSGVKRKSSDHRQSVASAQFAAPA